MVDRRQWSDVTQQNRILLLFYDGVEITSEAHNLGGGSVDHEDGVLNPVAVSQEFLRHAVTSSIIGYVVRHKDTSHIVAH